MKSYVIASFGFFSMLALPSASFALSCPADTVCEDYTYDVHGRLVEVDREIKNESNATVKNVNVVYDYDEAGNRIAKDTS